jgi:hypothetical protein
MVPLAIATCVILALFLSCGWGVQNALADLAQYRNVYQIEKKSGETINASLIRSFDKGILILKVDRQTLGFIRWDGISALNRHAETEDSEPSGCRILGLFCRDGYEP